jgi:hypothetical protein
MILLEVVAALVIVGVILWALTQFEIDPMIAKIIRVLVVVVVTIWIVYVLLGLAGGSASLGAHPAHRLP